jgi:hypothetical protein
VSLSLCNFHLLNDSVVVLCLIILLCGEGLSFHRFNVNNFARKLVSVRDSLHKILSKILNFLLLVCLESVNRLESILLIFTHVAIPGVSKFLELLSLDLLNVDQLRLLCLFHLSDLTIILDNG